MIREFNKKTGTTMGGYLQYHMKCYNYKKKLLSIAAPICAGAHIS